ncbi:hypothetical protein MNBD_GAMMA09-3892 [hydrothermal vent metagenome]|uniref:Uncharacterized protein n=1 Tax=hydrothermal vent metagenome TaxID=652676 RepID=A0A3B0XE71_9ZZZZ
MNMHGVEQIKMQALVYKPSTGHSMSSEQLITLKIQLYE